MLVEFLHPRELQFVSLFLFHLTLHHLLFCDFSFSAQRIDSLATRGDLTGTGLLYNIFLFFIVGDLYVCCIDIDIKLGCLLDELRDSVFFIQAASLL